MKPPSPRTEENNGHVPDSHNIMPDNIERNQTLVTEFQLLGLGNLHRFRIPLFILFLIAHVMALASNVLVITLVVANQTLHSPMYFFLSQLSLCEILFTSNLVPNMLWLIWVSGGKVSIARCISQFFLLAVPTITQCVLLASMSFDRYVAICKPLHYTVIMTFTHQRQMVIFCWLVGLTLSFALYVFLKQLKFCDLDVINHFFCDIPPLVQISCSDTYFMKLLTSLVSGAVVPFPFLFIVVTYIFILRAVLKIPSTTGRKKAFSTCSSHLIVVCTYYGTLSTVYILPPRENSVNTNKGLSLLYILVTPLFNPLVYSLRNQDIRAAAVKSLRKLGLQNI